MAEYHLDKESRQNSMAFPVTVIISMDEVHSSESYRRSPSRTCKHSLNNTIFSHCLDSGTLLQMKLLYCFKSNEIDDAVLWSCDVCNI